MASISSAPAPHATDLSDPRTQAFALLRVGFTVAPILFGIDKFTNWMVEWSIYLWSGFDALIPGSADAAMMLIGIVEVLAGVLVAVRPRLGGLVVAAWLGGIVVNLLLLGDHYDVALRDVGLLLGAVTLSRLAAAHGEPLLGRRA